MAWLTRETARSYSRTPKEPDMETLAYWVARLEPLIRTEGEEEIIIVIANRTGVEDDAVYAGTSCVLGIHRGEVKLYGVLGRGERELLVVDTNKRPLAKLVHDPPVHTTENASNTSKSTSNSTETNGSATTNGTHSTNTTASSSNGVVSIEDDEVQLTIDEVLSGILPISPVETGSAHQFFHADPTKPEDREPVRSSTATLPTEVSTTLKSSTEGTYHGLKSAVNGINRNDNSATPVDFERPNSPKSRNASRTRQPMVQEQALRCHDLAGDHAQHRRPPSRGGIIPVGLRGVPSSAVDTNGANSPTPFWQENGGDNNLAHLMVNGPSSPRPRSTGW
jgi:hypothetical protein